MDVIGEKVLQRLDPPSKERNSSKTPAIELRNHYEDNLYVSVKQGSGTSLQPSRPPLASAPSLGDVFHSRFN